MKVSFQDWSGRKIVILFYDVEEFRGFDSSEQCILYQDIGAFFVHKMENDFNEYRFVGAWDENTFLKIRGKQMEIYEVGVAKDINSALFRLDIDYIGNQSPEVE